MKQLLILSGKGGTGKTTIAGAFIKLYNARAYADCDVDAPNLHLISKHKNLPKKKDYYGLPKANIDLDLCIECGLCQANCRFEAIDYQDGYFVDTNACEGCGVCEFICPASAVSLKETVAGELFLYKNDSVFSTAKLKMGSGTSGKLVAEVKKQLLENAKKVEIAIIDGSPGIGCPVIASLSGADIALIVAEPSVSGISDMERIIKTAHHFETKIAVCVNKYDINLSNTEKIEAFCADNNVAYLGRIPYDSLAVMAINSGKSIVEIDCPSGNAVKAVYARVIELIQKEDNL
ncbi:MAG TPA: ATP-binding protein [Bacilli bacterium]|nr:ATP-binding protein [Bacilli bacterium]